jgi:hypothetical protein
MDTTIDNQQERRFIELGWLAGAIDGEGCFAICLCKGKKYYLYPMMNISNTDDVFTDEVIRILDKYKVPYYIQTRKTTKLNHKNSKSVFVKGMKRTKKLIDLIYPFIVRKNRVDIYREFVERRIGQNGLPARYKYTYSPRDIELAMQLRELNGNRKNESSESICRTLDMTSDDVLRTAMRVAESTRNELTA